MFSLSRISIVLRLFVRSCRVFRLYGAALAPASEQTDGAWIRLGSDSMTDRWDRREFFNISASTTRWFFLDFFFDDLTLNKVLVKSSYVCAWSDKAFLSRGWNTRAGFLCTEQVIEFIRPTESCLAKLRLPTWIEISSFAFFCTLITLKSCCLKLYTWLVMGSQCFCCLCIYVYLIFLNRLWAGRVGI